MRFRFSESFANRCPEDEVEAVLGSLRRLVDERLAREIVSRLRRSQQRENE